MIEEREGCEEEWLGNLSLMILCYVVGEAEVKVWSVEHRSLPLKPCKRQSIQSVILTVYKVLETMPLGAQVNGEHQSTGGRHQKCKVLQLHSHYCSHQVSGYKRPDYLSPPDNVIWFEIITWCQAPHVKMSEVAEEQQLHAEGTHFL